MLDCAAQIITIIDKVRIEMQCCWVLTVLSGGLVLPAGHLSLVNTDLVPGDWLTLSILPTDDREETTNHL